jgi:hypothetical protein
MLMRRCGLRVRLGKATGSRHKAFSSSTGKPILELYHSVNTPTTGQYTHST